MEERRKSQRYGLKDDIFITLSKPCLWKRHKTSRLFAPIFNINFKGIAFKYINRGLFALEYNLISILLPNKMHAIEKLPFKVVHDKKISDLPHSLELRKRGGKFDFFNLEKKAEFEKFFYDYAMMDVTDSIRQRLTVFEDKSLVA